MKRFARVLGTALVATGLVIPLTAAGDLQPGDKAPNFSVQGTDDHAHTLDQLKGHWVVLAWFPKAFTSG
jgi:peroxiredoxin Q/BCP